MEAFRHTVYSIPPGVGWGHKRESNDGVLGKIFEYRPR
jgi:hypothetical protein